ncbi:MAG: ABC transporter ATP-binding protein [Thermoplasmata archaeon]|nr:MAG: ABC transporter ATP-binding protein [Thermoplasmata archaeon]
MSKVVIKSENLTKVFDNNTRALNGINLTISKGEWVTIMGPSGSGKTTLLNILGGLDKPSNGTVFVDGKDITKLNSRLLTKYRRENIGFIFQQFHLVPYLNAVENVMLAQYFHSIALEQDAEEVLERVGLKERLTHLPTQMSGGEQQRVAVARAIANEPEILLADEPTGNLDQTNGKVVLDLLESLHKEGHTIVMITHDINIAKRSQRIIKLIDGKIYSDKSTRVKSKNPDKKILKNISKKIGG